MVTKFITFTGKKAGFFTADRDARMLEKANAKAQEWLNSNPNVEIVNITSAFGQVMATTTIWYKENSYPKC